MVGKERSGGNGGGQSPEWQQRALWTVCHGGGVSEEYLRTCRYYYGLNVYVSSNSYVEILTPNVIA